MGKRINVFAIIFAVTSILGCSKFDKKYTQFTLDYDGYASIPSNTGLNLPIDFFTPEQETNSEQEFTVNDTRKDLVEKITLETANLAITSPSGQTFAFINDIYLYINADGLEEKLLASKTDIPESVGNTLELNTTESDFKDYIKKDRFTLKIKVITDKITNRDVDITIHTSFFVDAKILGQ